MARSCLAIFLLLCLLSSLFLFSCSEQVPENSSTPEQNGVTENKQDAADDSGEDDTPEEDEPRVPPEEENPASDFTWQTGKDNTVTITKYVGTDTTVVVPAQISGKDVVEIGHAAFAITEIESIFLPDSIITIGPLAFQYCRKLEKVDMSNFVTAINGNAFADCSLLEEILLPKSIEFIGMTAFKNCVALKTIHLPRNLKLGGETFVYSGLESVTFEAGFSGFSKNDFGATKIKQIVLPKGCKIITDYALGIGESLEEIVLNDDLEEIESMAFAGNSNLKKIVIPSSVKRMGSEPFSGCTSLEEVLFEGDAPNLTDKREELFYVDLDALNYVVYHHKEAKGFTSPEWNEHQTKIW